MFEQLVGLREGVRQGSLKGAGLQDKERQRKVCLEIVPAAAVGQGFVLEIGCISGCHDSVVSSAKGVPCFHDSIPWRVPQLHITQAGTWFECIAMRCTCSVRATCAQPSVALGP